MLTPSQTALASAAGIPICDTVPLTGGDTSTVVRMGSWVLKTTDSSTPLNLTVAEAHGLKRLKSAGCLTPDVRHVSPAGLVLKFYPNTTATDDDYALFATQLATLHRTKRHNYGDNSLTFLGPIRLNAIDSSTNWSEAFVQNRLRTMHHQAALQDPNVTVIDLKQIEQVQLPEEGPCLVHGDLWQGNVLATEYGLMMLDPSCWVSERGIDIAMLRLFGCLPESFWTTYLSAYPLPDRVKATVPLYQLYYALAHVALFGSSYTKLCLSLWESFNVQNT